MDRLLIFDAIRVGHEAASALCGDDTSYRSFLSAVQRIHDGLKDAFHQVRIYSFDRERQILFEEAVAGESEGQGDDQLYFSQLPTDLVEKGTPHQRQVANHQELLTPLIAGGSLCGLIIVHLSVPLTNELSQAIQTVGHMVAPAVHATLEKRRAKQLTGFLRSAVRMSRELAGVSGNGSDRLLYHHVTLVVEELGFDRATLFTFESDGKRVERGICAIAGQTPFEVDRIDTIRVPALNDDPLPLEEFPGVWVPINAGTRKLGALLADNLYSMQMPPMDSVRVLVDVSGQVALAMQNAQLLERLQEMALRDELTGLFRPGYFNERIQEELNKVEREGSSAGLLFIDLDDFKRVNDAHGHHAGDAVLVQIADVIRSSIRASDVACRMGGDEFLVLLPGLSMSATHALSDRFCRRIGEHHFLLPDGGTVQLTASVGVASFPEDASGWHQLIRRADEAMYVEKRARKSRARAATDHPAS